MVATSSNLIGIRTALVGLLTSQSAAVGSPVITYQAAPQPRQVAADATIVRVHVDLPARTIVASAGEPIVRQEGTLTLHWLFPKATGLAVVQDRMEAAAAIYREQTLAGGITLTGDAQVTRVGPDTTVIGTSVVESGRTRWDLSLRWRTEEPEAAAGDSDAPLGLDMPTTADALRAVRDVWAARIEQAVLSESWSGLRTIWDDEPSFAAPPSMPWAGYWCDSIASASPETSAGTETVVGRSLVQLHTDPSLGVAVPLAITERIVAEHNRTFRGVRMGPVLTLRQTTSPAGTFQTNLRIPFRFERLRA